MREAIPVEIREAVLQRDGACCRYCLRYTQTIHLDHIFPVSSGGLNHVGNLVVACASCNLSKHASVARVREQLPHMWIYCAECEHPIRAREADGWGVGLRGPFGWCARCWDMSCEKQSWDRLQFSEDLGLEPLAA